MEPLVPVTVTEYVPAGVAAVVAAVSVDCSDEPGVNPIFALLTLTVNPAAGGLTIEDKVTLPDRPMLSKTIVDVTVPPAMIAEGVDGLAEIAKSGRTVTCMLAE